MSELRWACAAGRELDSAVDAGKLWSSEMDSHTAFEPLTSTEREKGQDTGAWGPEEAAAPAMPRTGISACMSVAATPATTSARPLPESFFSDDMVVFRWYFPKTIFFQYYRTNFSF